MASDEQGSDRPDTGTGGSVDQESDERGSERTKIGLDRSDESQDFVDTSKIDFDPDEGVYNGTAVDGTSEIPGPHLESESGELSPEDLQQEARKQADDAGVDPDDTPAAKSPVARAAEQERQRGESGGDGDDAGTDEAEE